MNIVISREGLSPKQLKYLQCKEDNALFGGARGGGKTHVNRILAVELIYMFPGMNIMFVRPTIKSAREQFTKGMMSKIIPSVVTDEEGNKIPIWKFDGQDSKFLFANGPDPDNPFEGGSVLILGGITTMKDAQDSYQGIEFSAVVWDELTKSDWDAVTYTIMSLRNSDPTQPDPIFRASSNPGARSHLQVKKAYVDPWKKLKRTVKVNGKHKYDEDYNDKISWRKKDIDEETGEELFTTYCYIPATLDDNPVAKVRNTYKKAIAQEPNEVLRKMYRSGSWDVYKGKYWDDIDFADMHLTVKEIEDKYNIDFEFELQVGKTFLSMDWGYSDYTCIHWHLETTKGPVITFKEYYQNKKLMEEIAREVEEINDKLKIKPDFIHMPWDMYVKKGGKISNSSGIIIGEELVDVWRYYSTVPDLKASGNRIQGWNAMTKAIKNEIKYDVMEGSTRRSIVVPKWIILKGNAPKLYEQLDSAQIDMKNIEDITLKEDHAIDCSRMFWVSYMPSDEVEEVMKAPPKGTVDRRRYDIVKKREYETSSEYLKVTSVFNSDY